MLSKNPVQIYLENVVYTSLIDLDVVTIFPEFVYNVSPSIRAGHFQATYLECIQNMH